MYWNNSWNIASLFLEQIKKYIFNKFENSEHRSIFAVDIKRHLKFQKGKIDIKQKSAW